ncbi:hypothetical protein CASFOL_017118 [Castilleja foliolosa]|uniref:Glycosyltransferase n=1 Tax=Castilleja foliolosa TaxID=1961234 RepID=A0ABD3DC96_9LAMI
MQHEPETKSRSGARQGKNMSQSLIVRSGIAATIGLGVAAGLIFIFLFPRGFFFFSVNAPITNQSLSKPDLKVDSSPCESTEKLRLDNARLSNDIIVLKKKIQNLNEKLKKHSDAQFTSLCDPQKPGPFGTVKASRTNPSIIPDQTLNPRLAKILSKIAVKNELIVALANSNVQQILQLWFTSIKKTGIPNYLVIALDSETFDFCVKNDVPVYQTGPDENIDSVGKTASSHAVSGLKFRVLREFLQMGYSVLLSDIDVVYIQNPFHHLHRDCDVESMSDGHNNMTAYGYDDVFDEPEMGWSRYAHTMRIWVYNSGFFYIRPTLPSIELLDRVADELARNENAWDQAVFNEELFYPSSPGYVGLHASRRTMDMYLFMNSKVLFKTVRKDDRLRRIKPVVVHVNYHLDKIPRMRGVFEFYVDGKKNALESFSDASDWQPNDE